MEPRPDGEDCDTQIIGLHYLRPHLWLVRVVGSSIPVDPHGCPLPGLVQCSKRGENFVIGQIRRPAISSGDRNIELSVSGV
jgi:hypothetical protein